MKWNNMIENRVLTIINLIVFSLVIWLLVLPGYNARIESLERQNKAKDEVIVELSKIAKYAITNQYDKIKAKDGTIILDLNNTMDVDNASETQINSQGDTIKVNPPQKEKSFWKKLKFWEK